MKQKSKLQPGESSIRVARNLLESSRYLGELFLHHLLF